MSEGRSKVFRHHVNLKFCGGVLETLIDEQLRKLAERLGRVLIRETRRFYPSTSAESLVTSEMSPP